MQKNWFWLFIPFILAACSAEKIPITGDRIAVVDYENSIKVDEETKNTPVSLPLPELNENWAQMGRESSHVMPNLSLSGPLNAQWTASIGYGNGEGRLLSTPIVHEGVLYVLDTYGNVSALNTATGGGIWMTDISPEG